VKTGRGKEEVIERGQRVRSVDELRVHQAAVALAVDVYTVTAHFPLDERYGLISQMRRAAVSIGSNLAEGWGRGKRANLANFTRIARGSVFELRTLGTIASRLGYLETPEGLTLDTQIADVTALLTAFPGSVEASGVRETVSSYDQSLDSQLHLPSSIFLEPNSTEQGAI
jgi:four helix bundle protein